MAENWEAWSARNKEFAPIIGLHKHSLFYPTRIEAFFKEQIELRVHVKTLPDKGPIYGSIREFSECTIFEKIQWMLNPHINKKMSYLDRFGGKIDVKRSQKLQKSEPYQVYVRGFRNKETNEAYITYWFFYLENFVPKTTNDDKIIELLKEKPNKWWTHEGDWEAISVHFLDFQASTPTEVIFSHHNEPKKRLWENVPLKDDRILVSPAIGSHANFFEPIRKKRFPGLSYCEVASPDKLIFPKIRNSSKTRTYQLEALDPQRKHLWLHFKGRWGQSSGEVGLAPTGPLMKKGIHFKLRADIRS